MATWNTIKNQKNGKVTIHVAGANSANIIVVGNSSQSNLAISTEVLSGATIRKFKWGTDGVIHIRRDSTIIWYLTQSGEMDFSDGNMLNVNAAGNLSINVSSSNSSVIIELDKQFTTMTQEF